MLKIKIGEDERLYSEIDRNWVVQQINHRREDGQSVCVILTIEWKEINLILFSRNCHETGSGDKSTLSSVEIEIINIWTDRIFSRPNVNGGEILAFVQLLINRYGIE